jgi:hypothetical protein
MAKPKTHQVGQAGEHFVAAELHRRGGYAVTFSGNMPNIDVLASDAGHSRTVAIQVKTKTAGSWHTSTTRGAVRGEDSADDRLWVLVDIGQDPSQPPIATLRSSRLGVSSMVQLVTPGVARWTACYSLRSSSRL